MPTSGSLAALGCHKIPVSSDFVMSCPQSTVSLPAKFGREVQQYDRLQAGGSTGLPTVRRSPQDGKPRSSKWMLRKRPLPSCAYCSVLRWDRPARNRIHRLSASRIHKKNSTPIEGGAADFCWNTGLFCPPFDTRERLAPRSVAFGRFMEIG